MKASLYLIILLLICSNVITLAVALPSHRLYECQRLSNRGYWLDVYIVTYTPVNYTIYQNQELTAYTRMQPIYGLKRGKELSQEEYQDRCE